MDTSKMTLRQIFDTTVAKERRDLEREHARDNLLLESALADFAAGRYGSAISTIVSVIRSGNVTREQMALLSQIDTISPVKSLDDLQEHFKTANRIVYGE